MSTFGVTYPNGESDEVEVDESAATIIKNGFASGQPFVLDSTEGDWLWFNPDNIAVAEIEA